tara:strand:- start:2592 stop:2777 length:186 start_codon:yes stop_codon:yes gene_type:complete
VFLEEIKNNEYSPPPFSRQRSRTGLSYKPSGRLLKGESTLFKKPPPYAGVFLCIYAAQIEE